MRALVIAIAVMGALAMPAWADLFNTTSVRTRNINSIPKWIDVLSRTEREDLRGQCAAGQCGGKEESWWEKMPDWSRESRFNQMVQVNRWLNNYPYITDSELLGRSDFWQTPGQFITRSGDCEDYAIAKYYTLKALGWSEDELRLVVVHDTLRNIPHAVLAVSVDGGTYILDNLASEPLLHQYVRQYTPYYAINAKYRWVFIK